MVCLHCNSVINVEALRALDQALAPEQAPQSVSWGYEGDDWRPEEQKGMAVYSCKSCGGEIVGAETLGATSCPFCGTPVVMVTKFAGDLRPDMVIPFKLDRDAAIAALQKHYLNKKLLPKEFKDKRHLDEVKGVYIPFWLFDADVDAKVIYDATKERTWQSAGYKYTETSVYSVTREGGVTFNKVPIDGSEDMDDALMEAIEPFYTDKAVDFQSAYLAGFFANKYDEDANTCAPRANERIKLGTAHAFGQTVTGYKMVTPKNIDIRLKSTGVHYALFPVWLLSTTWQGKKYPFAMNAQTGKLIGDLPLDVAAKKSWFRKILWITAAVIFVLCWILFL